MKIPKSQTDKYNLIGKEINFIDETNVLECGKIGGFGIDSVIVVTHDDLGGSDIDPEFVYLPDEE